MPTPENTTSSAGAPATTPLGNGSPKVIPEVKITGATVVGELNSTGPKVISEETKGAAVVTEEQQESAPTIVLDKSEDKNEPKDDAKTTDKKKLPLRWMNHIIGGIDDIGKAISDAVQNMFISIYNQINFFSRWGKDVPDEDTDLTAGKKDTSTKPKTNSLDTSKESIASSSAENVLLETQHLAELTASKPQETPAYDAFTKKSLPASEHPQKSKKFTASSPEKSGNKKPHP